MTKTKVAPFYLGHGVEDDYYVALRRGRVKRCTTSVCPSVRTVPPIFSKLETLETSSLAET